MSKKQSPSLDDPRINAFGVGYVVGNFVAGANTLNARHMSWGVMLTEEYFQIVGTWDDEEDPEVLYQVRWDLLYAIQPTIREDLYKLLTPEEGE